MEREDYFFEYSEQAAQDKILALIIYDISDNKKRLKLSKFLQGYGKRVQKSAFEAVLTPGKYNKMLKLLPQYVGRDDSVRVYKIQGKGQITNFGVFKDDENEDLIII